MYPNIIFFLIDGLRADQFYGNNRTCKTPNIDSLIKNGIFCEQAVSSADGTITSLNTLFTSNFQVSNAAKYRKLVLNQNNFIDILKKNGYHIYGIFPNFTSFNSLRRYFENKNNSFHWIEDNAPPETLPTGLTERITRVLESTEKQEPYFCYFHIFDIHPLREGNKPIGIEKFDNEEFGSNMYARTVSSIDYWLGKILTKIDIEKTLLVITGDHGERIPFDDKGYSDFQPKFNSATKFGRKHLPASTHKIGGKIFGRVKNTIGKAKLSYSNTELTPYQKRSRDPHYTLSLFDELIRVPLIFSGIKLPQMIISQQVSLADIFPTICGLIDLPPFNITTDGRSLVPLINGNSQKEHPIYLHTMPYEKPSPLDSVGLRTSKYKYFRAENNMNENVNLYDLKNDPFENNNIAKTNEELVTRFEQMLMEMQNDNFLQDEENPEELQKIEFELKKMGYM